MRNLEHLMKMWKGKGKLVGVGLLLAVAVGLSVQGCGSKTTVTESETTVEASVETTQAELPVNEEEEELLSKLYRAISEADYAETAKVLNENEEAFESLMAGSLSGEKYCYREIEDENGQTICEMEPMGSSDEVEGMVVTRFNTVFYGTFSDGKPNGECRAVQAMILDQPRYSYAEGIWKDGKMNGEGKTGYHYYLNAPEAGFVRTDKEGNYLNNLLDGEFVYRTESSGGEILSWNMRAVNGVTVITQNWVHYPFRKEYMLSSEEDEGRAYVLSEDKVASQMWNNLIVWDE